MSNVNQGVYIIHSKYSEKVYIGSTYNFDSRTLSHISMLEKGTHHCIHLQRHVLKAINMRSHVNVKDFIVFEYIPYPDLSRREIYLQEQKLLDKHIDTWGKSIFNISKDAFSSGYWGKRTEVYMFNLNGEFLAEYDSLSQASGHNNVRASDISRCIYSGLDESVQIVKSTGGKLWASTPNLPKPLSWYLSHENNINQCKVTVQTKSDKKVFISMAQAALWLSKITGKNYKTCISSISQNCRGVIKSTNRMVFSFVDLECAEKLKVRNTPKSIDQYTIDGKYLRTFKGVKTACIVLAKELNRNISPSSIIYCARGRQKTAYGFVWKYKDSI